MNEHARAARRWLGALTASTVVGVGGPSAWLGGCCLTSAPDAPPPPVPSPNAPHTAPVPTTPTAPSSSCPTIEVAILGTWSRGDFVEEYRPGGVYVINGHEGTVRWLGQGRAFLEVPPDFHEEYTLALADVNVLLAAGPDRVGTIYQRTSPPPAISPSCWDVHDAIVGSWAGGPFAETYDADGSYRVNELAGRWEVRGNGIVHLETQAGEGDYYFAITSPMTAVAMMRTEGARLTSYTRTR